MRDAEFQQEKQDHLERIETLEAIRRGLEEAERGEGRPAREVFAELSAKFGISR